MADPKSQQDAQAESGTVEVTEFDSLLRKEFKPKTDEAKEAVERAVRTLAEQALSQTKLISGDVVKSIDRGTISTRNEMPVRVHRDLNRRVSELVLHVGEALAVRDQERRVRVAEIVDPNLPKAGLLEHPRPNARVEVVAVEHAAARAPFRARIAL